MSWFTEIRDAVTGAASQAITTKVAEVSPPPAPAKPTNASVFGAVTSQGWEAPAVIAAAVAAIVLLGRM